MSSGESLYLLMVLGGFAAFILVLAYVSEDWAKHHRKESRAHPLPGQSDRQLGSKAYPPSSQSTASAA